MGIAVAFWILTVAAVLGALGVVLMRNVFRAALSLVLCFLAVAGLYVTLSADFLAAVQVLVYVGAIAILIILAIMLTRDVPRGSPGNRLQLPSFIIAALFMGIVTYIITRTSWSLAGITPTEPTTAALAGKLFSEGGFILPLEIAPILLLAAILGAIVLVREK